ncbi:hypothetical protein J2W40_001467 [Sphingobium xenophagum]|uniref:Flagellar hook-length control protein-like C-terminal domain-containing protein n=1 Tax=Sphingobium xenophagum TaxID=121428 RepID=A0ABU1X0Q8_SPHXE|nr:hypothetical protein [Sphingobium xenophagum]MDR7154652.1 hypothetical protein [Sphingobium xenophagum]
MTMLASIKALLFPTPAGGTGKGAGIAPTPGLPDFAQLLDAATTPPSATALTPDAVTLAPNAMATLPNAMPPAPDAEMSAPAAAFAVTPVQQRESGQGDLTADPTQPVPARSDAPAMAATLATTPTQPPRVASADGATDTPILRTQDVPEAPEPVAMPARPLPTPTPETGESRAPIPQETDSQPVTPTPLAQPVPASDKAATAAPAKASATAVRAPMADSETDSEMDIESDAVTGPEKAEPLSASLSVSAQAEPSQDATMSVQPSPQAPIRSTDPDVEPVNRAAAAQPTSAAPLADASPDRLLSEETVPDQLADPLPLPDPAVAATGMAIPPAIPVPAPPIVADALPAEAKASPPPATPGSMTAVRDLSLAPAASPVESIATTDVAAAPLPTLTLDAPPPAHAPVRAEAVSLLQLVRDHMTGRAASSQPTEAVPRPDVDRDAVAPLLATPRSDMVAAPTALPFAAQPAALVPLQPTAPVVDLSASLGAQVVDMGVSGQWIDSLARDIAGLSANGAQGRFQINADTLGPIQVDIRQGDKGATVALTVATDLAEQALRQDGDRLRLDAGLAAVKISEVRIERAPADAATRPDPSGQNASGQPHQQQAGQPAFQGQGRWQGRENIASSHKGADEAAVLNHADAGDNSRNAVRARYA